MLVYLIASPSGKCYVGVTGNLKRRLRDHSKADSVIGRAFRKYKDQMRVQVLLMGPADYCFMMEQRIVDAYGTLSPNGYNQTGGGIGGRTPAPEVTARRTSSLKALWEDPDFRELERQRRWTPEARGRRAREAKARWDDPEKKAALIAARSTPEAKARHSASMLDAQNRPEVAEKKRQAAKLQWGTAREKIIQGMKARKPK